MSEESDEVEFCTRCGEEYDPWNDVEVPDDASFYWVPSCPRCGAGVTDPTVDLVLLRVCGKMLDSSDGNYERHRGRLHDYARLYHGRMVRLSADELLRRAKWFDKRVSHDGRRWGPEPDRNVAFNLRRQAREAIA